MRRAIIGVLGSSLALGLIACGGEVTSPEGWRQQGVLLMTGWSGPYPLHAGNGEGVAWVGERGQSDISAPEVLVAPDTVAAGEAFEVTTNTVGPSGCWRSDGQSVTTFGRTVTFKPYDSHSGSEVCTEALVFPAHSSTVILYDTGAWTLRVEGRRLRLGDDVWDEPVSAEKTVVVR